MVDAPTLSGIKELAKYGLAAVGNFKLQLDWSSEDVISWLAGLLPRPFEEIGGSSQIVPVRMARKRLTSEEGSMAADEVLDRMGRHDWLFISE